MPRPFALFLVILFGLFLGLGSHALTDQAFAKNKSQQVANIFEQICIKGEPARNFQDRIPPRMVRSDSFGPDALIWIDPVTKVFLTIKDTRCSMNLYGDAAFLTDETGHALLSVVTELVSKHFPQLKIDPKAKMHPDDIFVAWSNWERTDPATPQRGAVILWIYDHGEKSTFLSLTLPRDGTSLTPSTSP
ncbi:MAG: hypothetical protein ACRBBS_12210 [Thalassovita sp.]